MNNFQCVVLDVILYNENLSESDKLRVIALQLRVIALHLRVIALQLRFIALQLRVSALVLLGSYNF